MCDFTHLHVHTDASPDGLSPLETLVSNATKKGFSALACTDHGTLANAVSFWKNCTDNGIKPIFGLEAYFLWNSKRHHITLNSMSQRGFNNLIALSNKAHENWTSGYPVMTADMMGSSDLDDIALFTGCPASPIHEGTFADATKWVGAMHDLFGDRLWVELMCVIDEDVTSRPIEIAKRFNLPVLLTNDVHYPERDMRGAHRILTECRKGFSYDSDRLWLKTGDEMRQTAIRLFDGDDVDKWMLNTALFAGMVDTWSMTSSPQLPSVAHMEVDFFNVLNEHFVNDTSWRSSADQHMRRQRYEIEVKILKDMNFVSYFIILNDIIQWARSQDILIGPGRGSAAGSYLLFLLGVTGIDPIEHNLYFERFLNVKRKEYPDVDIDIESDRRQDVLEYARQKWGGVPIATYAHYGHKVAVQDIGRVLRIDRELTLEASEKGPESAAFEEFAAKNKHVLSAYNAMQGQIRHAGKHAGGVVITNQPIPIENIGGTSVAAWVEGHNKELSSVGVVKYDMLGLTALSQIHKMRKLTGQEGVAIPEDDHDIFSIFQKGDVLGIFQWTGSDGIRDLTVRIAPNTFTDLAVINSLYRPGALDAGTADLYPSLKDNPRLLEPRIDAILSDTRGVIVFQEQVMAIFAVVTGISFEDADLARRVIFKVRYDDPKWVASVEEMQREFYDKGSENGFSASLLRQLWSEIFTHTRYSFNRAHAAAYTAVACEMAWFKLYYPATFYAVAMSYDVENIQAYLLEAAAKGIELRAPHVNAPCSEYIGHSAASVSASDSSSIQLPLSIVKFFSPEGAKKVVDEHESNGPFLSIDDFRDRVPKRICNSRACRNLYTLGAFDGLPGDPESLFNVKDNEDIISGMEAQAEALGFILPTPKMAKYVMSANSDARTIVGFVRDWKDKTNKRGTKYRVYYMIPRGIFWTDDGFDKIKKGDFLKIEKNHWGKASTKKRLRVSP